jgi:hypothetical protein
MCGIVGYVGQRSAQVARLAVDLGGHDGAVVLAQTGRRRPERHRGVGTGEDDADRDGHEGAPVR